MKTDLELKNFYEVEFGKTYRIINSHGLDLYGLVGKTFHLERRLNEKHGDIHIRDENSSIFALHILDDYDYVEVGSPSMLTTKEKEYLSNILKPFKDRAPKIRKFSCLGGKVEALAIGLEMVEGLIDYPRDSIYLPFFKTGTMYKNLIEGVLYTPQDLGLY